MKTRKEAISTMVWNIKESIKNANDENGSVIYRHDEYRRARDFATALYHLDIIPERHWNWLLDIINYNIKSYKHNF